MIWKFIIAVWGLSVFAGIVADVATLNETLLGTRVGILTIPFLVGVIYLKRAAQRRYF